MNKDYVEMGVVEESFENKTILPTKKNILEKKVYNPYSKVALISDKDLKLFHVYFKKGEVNYVTGLLANKILRTTKHVKVYNVSKEDVKKTLKDEIKKELIQEITASQTEIKKEEVKIEKEEVKKEVSYPINKNKKVSKK